MRDDAYINVRNGLIRIVKGAHIYGYGILLFERGISHVHKELTIIADYRRLTGIEEAIYINEINSIKEYINNKEGKIK